MNHGSFKPFLPGGSAETGLNRQKWQKLAEVAKTISK